MGLYVSCCLLLFLRFVVGGRFVIRFRCIVFFLYVFGWFLFVWLCVVLCRYSFVSLCVLCIVFIL